MELKTRIKLFDSSNKKTNNNDQPSSRDESISNVLGYYSPTGFKTLSALELDFKDSVQAKLLDILDLSLISSIETKEAKKHIKSVAQKIIDEEPISINSQSRIQIISEIENDILGLGPLELLLYDPTISDILINGYKKVYVERFGKLQLTPITFNSDNHLMKIINRIVSKVGRRIDKSSPMVDARLQDGSRVNAIIPPLSIDGPSLSIRLFSVDKMHLDDLVERNALTSFMAEFLKVSAKSKVNILISGGTGSGKTTLLNAISNYIPNDERIITLEDSAELQLQLPHVLRLETRPENIEGKGEVSLRDLVRNSLRMRPDRIVIGEVRSSEAFDMLQAMNSGHEGSFTTVHANSPRDALSRLESMVSMAGVEIPAKTIRKQIASAIHLIIQLSRLEDGSRKIMSIQEVVGMEGDIITLSEIFKFTRHGVSEEGVVEGEFYSTGLLPKCLSNFQQRGNHLELSLFNSHIAKV
jgi:pilus assembly protein CpaF